MNRVLGEEHTLSVKSESVFKCDDGRVASPLDSVLLNGAGILVSGTS